MTPDDDGWIRAYPPETWWHNGALHIVERRYTFDGELTNYYVSCEYRLVCPEDAPKMSRRSVKSSVSFW